ncbi:MAG: response regulator transcription factor [Dermatophilaceae bacterium]
MVARVLVVEDDSTVSSVLSAYLRKAGFDPRMAADGATALQEWTQWKPDVVILDVMLPGLTGLEVLQRRRADDDSAAVIILSARGEEDDRLLGLELGADDYMVKPFSPREVVLRVQALLRRSERLGSDAMIPRTVAVGELFLDLQARIVEIRGETLSLTHREFDLLAYLMTHRDEAFTKEALMRRVWGWDFGDTSTVTVHVRRLREKIERDPSDPQFVMTVRGTGYRFDGKADS